MTKETRGNVESNIPSVSEIRQKTKRGLPPSQTTDTPETDRRLSSEEISLEEISPPVLPVTFAAPRVDRHLLYTYFGDEQYLG